MSKVEKNPNRAEFAEFKVGDIVDVHMKVQEGDKERIQIFSGLVMGIKGTGANKSFTVRRVVGDEGVERIFPFLSPTIAKVEVARKGKVRRAKLYYMRGRLGKQARIEERREIEEQGTSAGSGKPAEGGSK